MSTRTIVRRVRGLPASDGAGVKLTRIIGQRALEMLDPFLLLDEFGSDAATDYIAGFPDHPHRGFETVTYMLDGRMRHRDNAGNEGLLESGSVQWMTAGRGIVHSEMPEQDHGLMRGFQLWVNLPAADKMTAPRYQDIAPEKIPAVEPAQDVRVRVVAGDMFGARGP
ncbi:MAG TPA: pirin family protein, partial [Rhodanobacteraceae bacterium]|nr:pirin family protein [Rhodanobacteraceae bacterium]